MASASFLPTLTHFHIQQRHRKTHRRFSFSIRFEYHKYMLLLSWQHSYASFPCSSQSFSIIDLTCASASSFGNSLNVSESHMPTT